MTKIKEEVKKVYSEQLDEVISKPPSWLLTRGITFVFLLTLVLLGSTYFVQIPTDTIIAPIRIENSLSNEIVSSKVEARIAKILVKNGDYISKNTKVGFIQSSADHYDALRLLDTLKEINNKKTDIVLFKIELPILTTLGEFQNSYMQLRNLHLSLKRTNNLSSSKQSKLHSKEESYIIAPLIKSLTNEYYLKEQKLNLIESKNIPGKEDAKLKAEFVLELNRSMQFLKSNINSLKKIQLNNYSFNGYTKKMDLIFFNALNEFIGNLEDWKSKFVLSNKTEGKIIFSKIFQEKNQVSIGEELFYINQPAGQSNAELMLTESFRSKFKVGENIQLRFKEKSEKKSTYLLAKIKSVPNYKVGEQLFPVKIIIDNLPKEMLVKLKNGAQAEVITNSSNMLERIWQNIVKSKKIQY